MEFCTEIPVMLRARYLCQFIPLITLVIMYLVKVKEETKTELNLIREAFSKREGKEVSYNYVIEELLKVYREHSSEI